MSTNANLSNGAAQSMAGDFLAGEQALFGTSGQQTAKGRGQAQTDRPAPTVYLNVGLEFEVVDETTGEARIETVYLYKGLGMDTMEKAPIKASDTPAWVNQQTRTNLVQDALTKRGLKLKSGEQSAPFRLVGFLQRTKSAEPIKATDTATLAAIMAAFAD